MKLYKSWEEIEIAPIFLKQTKQFGVNNLYDDLKRPLSSGWILIHNEKNMLRLENLGTIAKIQNELNAIKFYLEYLFESELRKESHAILKVENNTLVIFADEKLRFKILLQLTKPNANECKYTIEEFMSFPGYWALENFEYEREPFDLKFQYSTSGYRIILREDQHIWRQYGCIQPMNSAMTSWTYEILKKLKIPSTEIDPCTFNIDSINDFLDLTNIFRERTSSF